MPGCKTGDRAVIIRDYFRAPTSNVGTFHVVEHQCLCVQGWWQLKAESPCQGVIAVSANKEALTMHVPCGGRHCAPDRCLQPIRGDKKPDELPAPSKELEYSHE